MKMQHIDGLTVTLSATDSDVSVVFKFKNEEEKKKFLVQKTLAFIKVEEIRVFTGNLIIHQ